MRKLLLHPLFGLGLGIRLILIVGISPLAATGWYVPFMDVSTRTVTLDPWSIWTAGGGTLAAFPYGYAMWFAFLPMTIVAKLVALPLRYGYELTLLATDFSLLLILRQLLPERVRVILVAYWLSPIVILASYALGLNDLVPALLLTASLFCVRRVEFKLAGVLCAAAISAKLSMIVALPFFVIYLYNNKSLRERLPEFLAGFVLCALALGAPFVSSGAAVQMLLSNPEIAKIYRLAISLGGNVFVYLVPLSYLIILYLTWRVRRLNFDLFQATTGMAFLSVVLMTPASPGWFVWSIPFLALYQGMSGVTAIILIGAFSTLYMLSTILVTPLQAEFDLASMLQVTTSFGSHEGSLLHTIMVAIGVILAIRIWREAISRNDFFRLSQKPFVIGIAGESGAGKDTFVEAIVGLFGEHSVTKLSGDDYHLWDRQKPMWQVMTHLNPMANDLEGFCNDLVSLTDGRTVRSRHYDHRTGKMSKPIQIKSNDIIIASGLHALYLPILRDCYDLTVYLDMDEGLRRFFKLDRDVRQRDHTVEGVLNSLEKRKPDSKRFIRPQAEFADLVLSLQPINPRVLEEIGDKERVHLKLVARTRHRFNELSLNRFLVGVSGLHVDMVVGDDGSEVQVTIEGETSAADLAMGAEILCPRVLEFLDIHPKWDEGMLGLMQLITLSHISQALTRRFTW